MSDEAAATVRFEARDQIATIVLDRPGRLNAVTAAMFASLMECLDRVDENDDIRAAIVTGNGRAFCAGADVSTGPEAAFAPRTEASERPAAKAMAGRDGGGVLVLRILACTKPIIAAVNGAAVGLGATMTLPMDFRLAATDARFSRQLLWRMTMAQDPMEAHRIESRLIAERAASPDAAEGVAAFLEKRPPAFPMKVSTDLPDPYPWWDELPVS